MTDSIPRAAKLVTGSKEDIWSIVNEAVAKSPVQPMINLGQGFFGYNPPDFLLQAMQDVIWRVDCNQYSPTKGRPRLRKALAGTYSKLMGRELDPETEITITTGANEGTLACYLAFVEPGDEVIVFEPFFDQFERNVEIPRGIVKHVPLREPRNAATERCSAADWRVDMEELGKAITPRTKMIVLNSPQNPIGKVFSRSELLAIGELCVKHSIIIISDEVYDRLDYSDTTPLTRISTLSEDIRSLALTVGSVGKNFYATGWRVGFVIGPQHLLKHVSEAHTQICYASPSPQQEAAAIGYELAETNGFWKQSREEMRQKMERFNEVWDELGLPYTVPDGGYFVLVNTTKIVIPEDYVFPDHVASRRRDSKICWFIINELGVAALPITGFYTKENAHVGEKYLRFAVCREDELLDLAKDRLRGLKLHISQSKY